MADQVRESGGSGRVKGVEGRVVASGPDRAAEGPGTARVPQNGLKKKKNHTSILFFAFYAFTTL